MLATNIETEVTEILEKKGKNRWMRTHDCAKEYANKNPSRETKFYRWSKKVEKGKVEGFQVVKLPGNISFIGLDSSDPRKIREKIENEYLELAPENALMVARIDFFLENFIDRNDPKNKEFLTMVKLLRDYHVKVGKAVGR